MTVHDSNRYAWATASVLILASIWELVRVIVVGPAPGFPPAHSYVMTGVLVALWTTTAFALSLRNKSERLKKAAWFLSFLALFAMATHALINRLADSPITLTFLIGAALLAFLLKRTWDQGERQRPAVR